MGEPRATVLAQVRKQLMLTGLLANGIGASVLAAFLLFLAPAVLHPAAVDELRRRSIPVFIGYMLVTLPLGSYVTRRRPFAPIERWLASGRPATDADRTRVLRFPRNFGLGSFVFWAIAAILFAALDASVAWAAAVTIVAAALLGGLTACSLQYLLVERIMRPITAMALAEGLPRHPGIPGVAGRMTMAWTLATGVPLFGIVVFAALDLTGTPLDERRIVAAALFLAVVALSVGLAAMLFAIKSVAEPLTSMRDALAGVESGDLEARVPIDDGSEVGLLQAGFNRMTAGLAERERLRAAFGAFVDPSLTERVIQEGIDLAGEEVELSLLFMDVRGFTSFSERAEPREVVAGLNELYECVVPIVLSHGGHASKFIGDGLLAVFGAPDRLADHADRAVAAGLEIVESVRRGQLRVGVGINSGRVVAGTIGGGGRVDFTVIGDPVNTAARVEAATRKTGDDLLITEATLALLHHHRDGWVERSTIALKGKEEAVCLYAPAPALTAARPVLVTPA
jgi:adenylate cyclase